MVLDAGSKQDTTQVQGYNRDARRITLRIGAPVKNGL